MTSIRLKFRPSRRDIAKGVLYFQVSHQRATRLLTTGCHIRADEWNSAASAIISRTPDSEIANEHLRRELSRLRSIAHKFERNEEKFTADDIINAYKNSFADSLFPFMRKIISQMKSLNKPRTAETYNAALNSFTAFRNGVDIPLSDIDSDTMRAYEAFLKKRGVTKNTSSFYMRILRAAYNRAIDEEIIEQRNPFRHVYTGVDKTVKRAIPLRDIKKIKNLDLSGRKSLRLSRDLFMFSFYTRGMSFIDMAHLRKSDLRNGMLTYRRQKTGQQLSIRWERCMQEIVDRWKSACDSAHLLPIIGGEDDERAQYKRKLYYTNRKLKEIARMINLSTILTTYVARHSWASIARDKHIPLSVISEGMGHDSEATTQIYLASISSNAIDRANRLILKDL